ncbi:MAG: molybdenum cofactor guanylyltransferase MobA [Paracoccaceae bacterium]
MKVGGVILAGGKSRRMGGGDKGLLTLGGRSILTHVIARLLPQVDKMVLNVNGNPDRFAGFDLPVVADSIDGFAGPLAGVLAGMDWGAAAGYEYIATVAADTPFFPENLVLALRMAQEGEGKPLAMAMTPDPERGFARHPTFGLWPVNLREDLRAALHQGVRKVVEWSEPQGCAMMVFTQGNPDPFFNVNTPADLARAEEMLKGLSK